MKCLKHKANLLIQITTGICVWEGKNIMTCSKYRYFLARPIEVKAKVKVKIRVTMSRTGSNWLGPYKRLIRSTLDFGGKR